MYGSEQVSFRQVFLSENYLAQRKMTNKFSYDTVQPGDISLDLMERELIFRLECNVLPLNYSEYTGMGISRSSRKRIK